MDRLIDGLLVTLIGMLVVFFGLVILIGLIKIITMLTTEKKKAKVAETPAPVAAAPVTAAPVAAKDDDALIAVITAAVSCMMEEGTAFTVRHVRRISNAPAWQKAGREEQIYSRF